jgi:hypothetical protein
MAGNEMDQLGPLAPLAGTWEGDKGDDTAPSDDRGVEKNKYRERIVFSPTGLVENHEQKLYGLRYHLQAFRLGEADPFHDQVGYWVWDAKAKQVFQSVTIPRGMAVLAGGSAETNAKSFKVTAELGSKTFGICSNPFLDREFQTVGYEAEIKIGNDEFSYDQNTKIQIKDQPKVFEHRDKNTLKRVKA